MLLSKLHSKGSKVATCGYAAISETKMEEVKGQGC